VVHFSDYRRTEIINPTSSEINLLPEKNGLDYGVHRILRPTTESIRLEQLGFRWNNHPGFYRSIQAFVACPERSSLICRQTGQVKF
jgi:hypothetical protein